MGSDTQGLGGQQGIHVIHQASSHHPHTPAPATVARTCHHMSVRPRQAHPANPATWGKPACSLAPHETCNFEQTCTKNRNKNIFCAKPLRTLLDMEAPQGLSIWYKGKFPTYSLTGPGPGWTSRSPAPPDLPQCTGGNTPGSPTSLWPPGSWPRWYRPVPSTHAGAGRGRGTSWC